MDIVSLLAVIGESSMETHSQAITSSWTCMLPRIIPAPQALLKASRPTRMPSLPSAVVGIHNGTLVPTLNFFPNIIHPIEELPQFSFVVYEIKHKNENWRSERPTSSDAKQPKNTSATTSFELSALENGPAPPPLQKRRTMKEKMTFNTSAPPHIPTKIYSPLNLLSIGSCLLTIGLLVWAFLVPDGTACLALFTISLASSIVGYASWWSPKLTQRVMTQRVPPGDVAIRTREGAFVLVKCDENVARELYTGTEECDYHIKTKTYRVLVGLGTFLLMVSVVLLGNCTFTMQAAIGVSYICLNGAFWATSLINKRQFWDLSAYQWEDITPEDAKNAHERRRPVDHNATGEPASFTRTMWYAIRETKKIGWIKKSGAAPTTPQWDKWLSMAEEEAVKGNRNWNAVEQQHMIVGQMDPIQSKDSAPIDNAEQRAPAIEVPPPDKR